MINGVWFVVSRVEGNQPRWTSAEHPVKNTAGTAGTTGNRRPEPLDPAPERVPASVPDLIIKSLPRQSQPRAPLLEPITIPNHKATNSDWNHNNHTTPPQEPFRLLLVRASSAMEHCGARPAWPDPPPGSPATPPRCPDHRRIP